MSETEALSADDYAVTLSDGTSVDVLEFVDSASISAGRKVQLDRYEPIEEQATLEVGFADTVVESGEDRLAVIMGTARAARDLCEHRIMSRLEQQIREEDFGDE